MLCDILYWYVSEPLSSFSMYFFCLHGVSFLYLRLFFFFAHTFSIKAFSVMVSFFSLFHFGGCSMLIIWLVSVTLAILPKN